MHTLALELMVGAGVCLDELRLGTNPNIMIAYCRDKGLYYMSRGPANTENERVYVYDTEPIETSPEKFYTSHGNVDYAFIVEVIDSMTVRVKASCTMPLEVPFYVIELTLEDDVLKGKKRHKVIYQDHDVWAFDTEHEIIPDGTIPQLYFVRVQTRDFSDSDNQLPHMAHSLKIYNHHVTNPLVAWVYSNVYNWNWGWPMPFPETTYDSSVMVNDRAIVYGYDSTHVFDGLRLVFNRTDYYWNYRGDSYPIATSLVVAADIERAFVNIRDLMYFQYHEDVEGVSTPKKLLTHRRLWT